MVADLLARRLIAAGDVLSATSVLRDLSRRNANVMVKRRAASSTSSKLASDADARREQLREAAAYAAWRPGGSSRCAAPSDHDAETGRPGRSAASPDGRDLRAFDLPNDGSDRKVGGLVGNVLARLYDGRPGPRQRILPAILLGSSSLHRPTVAALRG